MPRGHGFVCRPLCERGRAARRGKVGFAIGQNLIAPPFAVRAASLRLPRQSEIFRRQMYGQMGR